jgi:hypothetical protein
MNGHLRGLAEHALRKNVEENSQRAAWPIYEHYEIILDEAGKRYLRAPQATNGTTNEVKDWLRPLSRMSASLFLRFAHWVETPGLDRELDTERNTIAAEMWVRDYGVLGLNPPDRTIIGLLNSRRVTADYLGMPWRGGVARGWRNTAHGGRPEESIENFAFEAWEAHIVWRLYESIRSQEDVDISSVRQFMSSFEQGEPTVTGRSWVEQDIYSQDPELARRWTLAIVEDAVNRKIENHCYPIAQGAIGSYEQGWGFKSLLGAMWLQMMFLMVEDRRCWQCGKPLDPGMPSHARFCKNNGRCRAKWNYHNGEGKSSKEKRRQSRYIR